jgi:hypothetical protein
LPYQIPADVSYVFPHLVSPSLSCMYPSHRWTPVNLKVCYHTQPSHSYLPPTPSHSIAVSANRVWHRSTSNRVLAQTNSRRSCARGIRCTREKGPARLLKLYCYFQCLSKGTVLNRSFRRRSFPPRVDVCHRVSRRASHALGMAKDANMSSHHRSSLSANTYIGRKYIMLPSMPFDRLDVL